MYWMTHADHGTMPAYDTSEKARLESCGWTLLNEGESPNHAPKVKAKPPETPEMAELNAALSRLCEAMGNPDIDVKPGQTAGSALIDLAAARFVQVPDAPSVDADTPAEGDASAPVARRPGRPRKV